MKIEGAGTGMGGVAVAVASGQRSALALFGGHLRRLRAYAGMTQGECADRLGYSSQHIGNLETGRRMPPEAFAVAADALLGGREVLYGLWRLARDQASVGLGPLPVEGDVDAVEAAASTIHTYQAHLVPDLLQHSAYAAAVVGSSRPPLPPDQARAMVAARMARQRVLRRTHPHPPWLWAILDEAVLRRELGGPDVLRAQLDCLLERATLHTVTVQVLPFSAPASPALGASFTLLAHADTTDTVSVDTLDGSRLHRADPVTVTRHRAVFDYLRESALSAADSLSLLAHHRDRLTPATSRG